MAIVIMRKHKARNVNKDKATSLR